MTLRERKSWKDYQAKKSTGLTVKRLKKRLDMRIFLKALLMIAVMFALVKGGSFIYKKWTAKPPLRSYEEVLARFSETLKPTEISSDETFIKYSPNEDEDPYYIKLSIDRDLQKRMEDLLKRYKPPYAAVVAMDPKTGKILAMASYSSEDNSETNWCLKSPFQAASIFKFVTAAAAIEKMHYREDSTIAFNGGLYRLRERNVFDKSKRFYNRMTLSDAFAKSANIVFAKLVNRGIQPEDLKIYSHQFLFNRQIPFLFDVEQSKASIPEEKFKLAKAAAGFGDVTLSPLHGAMIASAVLNGGSIANPYMIEKIYNSERVLQYERTPDTFDTIMQPSTADIMKNMMQDTLRRGTIRKTFRGWSRNKVLSRLTIGGKTGSLNGSELNGQHDWFVGFGKDGEKEIAISAVIVNHNLWHIKPAYLAKEAFLKYFEKTKPKDYYLATSGRVIRIR